MRKLYFLIIAAALSASASSSAADLKLSDFSKRPNISRTQLMNNAQLRNNSLMAQPLANTPIQKRVKAKAPKFSEESESPVYITEAPAGELKTFYRNSYGYSYSWFGLYYGYDYGSVGDVVFADNGDVYIKNPFSQLVTNTYLKGHLDNDVITVKFPQPVYQEEYYGEVYDYYAAVMELDDEQSTFVESPTQELKFDYKNGEITQSEESSEYLLALAAYDEDENGEEALAWVGYGDAEYDFLPLTDEYVQAPTEGISKAGLILGSAGQIVDIANTGSEVYIKGFVPGFDDAWVKGSLSGNTLTIPSEQLVGEDYGHFIYYYGGASVLTYYDYLDTYYTTYEVGESLTFTYDPTTNIYTADGESPAIIANIGKDEEYVDFAFDVARIQPQGDITESKPANPVITDYEPYDANYEYGYIELSIPNLDTNGNVLPQDQLYYNLLVDETPYTFYPDEYWYLDYDELTEVPYQYTDQYDIILSESDLAKHTIYYYFQGNESIGVQTIYKSDNGQTYYSDPVIIDAAKVKSVVNDKAEVSSEVYYDITGRAIANPQTGLYIKKSIYSDGSVKAVKVIK